MSVIKITAKAFSLFLNLNPRLQPGAKPPVILSVLATKVSFIKLF